MGRIAAENRLRRCGGEPAMRWTSGSPAHCTLHLVRFSGCFWRVFWSRLCNSRRVKHTGNNGIGQLLGNVLACQNLTLNGWTAMPTSRWTENLRRTCRRRISQSWEPRLIEPIVRAGSLFQLLSCLCHFTTPRTRLHGNSSPDRLV